MNIAINVSKNKLFSNICIILNAFFGLICADDKNKVKEGIDNNNCRVAKKKIKVTK
jgi:hypothetical protein